MTLSLPSHPTGQVVPDLVTDTCISLIERVHGMFLASPLAYGHGTDNAWDEAVYLVTSIANLPDNESSLQVEMSDAVAKSVLGFAQRRIKERVPLAYLLGFCQYSGYRFIVQEGVVIPRSPIGPLILEGDLSPWENREVLKVLDLCTGSGCLGILAAYRYAEAEVVLVDNDMVAMGVAAENIELHRMTDRVSLLNADVTRGLPKDLGEFDLILCNPPYVDHVDVGALPEEFKKEPVHGLDGGVGGLDILIKVVEQAKDLLSENGFLVCEAGGSARAFNTKFNHLRPLMLDLPQSGEGVFLLERKSLIATS